MTLLDNYREVAELGPPPRLGFRGLSADGKFWVCVAAGGLPTLLIRHSPDRKKPSIARKHLSVEFGLSCEVLQPSEEALVDTFCVITFSRPEQASVDFFWAVCEGLVSSLNYDSSADEIFQAALGIADVLAELSRPANGTLLGLVGELLFIMGSGEPERWVEAWREDPEEVWDFYEAGLVVDAKATSRSTRVHEVSFAQANPPDHLEGYFASVAVVLVANGMTFESLMQSLIERLAASPGAISKVLRVVAATLGEDLGAASISLDLRASRDSLRIYRACDVPAVRGKLVSGVSAVRWVSDFQLANHFPVSVLNVGPAR
jgi:hypothetical protein